MRTWLCVPSRGGKRNAAHRTGAVLVWFALLLVVLLGMVGLVIDAGYLMAAHRQTQNAADAAALAGAHDLMRGRSTARESASHYLAENGLDAALAEINIPPVHSTHYAGASGYVEVIAKQEVKTFLIHILGVSPVQEVQAMAVAGSEAVSAGEGVAVLDRRTITGLSVTGGGRLKVLGLVTVNAAGVGTVVTDPANANVGTQSPNPAATASNNSTVLAAEINVTGGVNDRAGFRNVYNPDANPPDTSVLHWLQAPIADPLLTLPTPDITNGVVDIDRGSVSFGNADTVTLYPGIYRSITITGGNITFTPGIYVLSPQGTTSNSLKITGGTIKAEGVMFYNTGNSYSPKYGTPDINDGDNEPPFDKNTPIDDLTNYTAGIEINAATTFKPIHTGRYDYSWQTSRGYASPQLFNGMLFYQRRKMRKGLTITGNAADGQLQGTLYAKWAPVTISGQGTYYAQFLVGSMVITGTGDVTVNYAGQSLGRAPQIFLVE